MARDSSTGNSLVLNQGLNPLVNFNFMLRVELMFDLPCKSVKNFTRENEYEIIQEGGLNDYVHMRRKPISRPFTFEVERYTGVDYIDPIPNGADLVLPVMLFVSRYPNYFYPGVTARTYIFTGCTVIKKTYGELDAEHSGLLTETATIAYREMLCLDVPWSDMVKDNNKSYAMGTAVTTASIDKEYKKQVQEVDQTDQTGQSEAELPEVSKKGKIYAKPNAPTKTDQTEQNETEVPEVSKKGKAYAKPNALVKASVDKEYKDPNGPVTESVDKEYKKQVQEVDQTDQTEQNETEVPEVSKKGKAYAKPNAPVKASVDKEYKDPNGPETESVDKEYKDPNGPVTESVDKEYKDPNGPVTESVDKEYKDPNSPVTESVDKEYKKPAEPVSPTGRARYTSPPVTPTEITYTPPKE